MANPKASNAVFAFGSIETDVKGTISGTYLDLTSYSTSSTSISFNMLGGYDFSFRHNDSLSGARIISISLRYPLAPSRLHYSERVVLDGSDPRPYEFETTTSSVIAATQISPTVYRYDLKDYKFSGKARHTDDTRELTCNGFFVVQELTWPI
ncbi:hypothetical protein J2W70_002332 [Pseudomonas koreensis]|uniref:hypothetical protein n=1 Tax=Pseudomonas koreensis TaxID=198620 RepID=UPI002857993A|nr:hypothetical protein [Pseudomonas koreensis]MDR7054970.1 hypothetical protein [Pseudomonas koreensis]